MRHGSGAGERGRGASQTIGAVGIAATYVGTIVGAGFASGQEVLRFFTHFGPWGFAGLAVAAALLGLCGAAVMLESRACRAASHGDLLACLGGTWFARFYDVIITLFLFGTTAVMVAGSGAFFEERLGLPSIVGDLAMAVAAAATVLAGLRGVVAASSFVAPLLLASVAAVAIAAIAAFAGAPPDPGGVGGAVAGLSLWRTWWRPGEAAAPSWLLAAFLYVSYNIVLAPAVLTPLAARSGSRGALVWGGGVGGLLLGAAAACVNVAVLAGLPGSASCEVPMLYVVTSLGGTAATILRPIVALVLWAEIYTTAVGLLYGFATRLGSRGSPRPRTAEGPLFRRWVLAGGAGALVAARAGFSNMVTTIYPVVGYAGLLFVGVLLYRLVRLAWRGGRAA